MNDDQVPYRRTPRQIEYVLPGGWTVIAGRTDADNDYLSLKAVSAGDYWFHVRGMPGSHVILKCPAGKKPDRETLNKTAAIAAYHSKARKGGIVAVSCARARHVTKPEGAKPGAVRIRREVVLKVRPEKAGVPVQDGERIVNPRNSNE
jgi:predicted ribosome quality control (RQC) complex YloA/Tae2 family protein